MFRAPLYDKVTNEVTTKEELKTTKWEVTSRLRLASMVCRFLLIAVLPANRTLRFALGVRRRPVICLVRLPILSLVEHDTPRPGHTLAKQMQKPLEIISAFAFRRVKAALRRYSDFLVIGVFA